MPKTTSEKLNLDHLTSNSASLRSNLVNSSKSANSPRKTPKNPAKTVILIDILAAVLVVIFGLVYSFQNTPEQLAERELETLATDYYESYIYPSLSEAAQTSTDLTPFSTTLSDLLLWDNRAWQGKTRYLEQYCDTSATTVKIIPESLASASAFHLETKLFCEF